MWCFSIDVLQKVAFVLPDDRPPESMTNFPYPRRALLRTYKINLLGTKIANISLDILQKLKIVLPDDLHRAPGRPPSCSRTTPSR